MEVVRTLKSGWLTTGPRTFRFEKAFCDYIGSPFAIALSSCTAALHLALKAGGVQQGDEVITTCMTFCATGGAIEYVGAKPVFVDIDRLSFNIDPDLIEEKISSRTKAIIPVHYGGIPCDVDRIYALAERHGLLVIEDAAHAVGSVYKNRKIGSHGNPTAFSFYPTKNMTTGEGGVLVTDNEEFANKVRVLSLHGVSKDAWKRYGQFGQWYYEVHSLGYKYNFTDIQAALGLKQLLKLDRFNAAREYLAKIYFDELEHFSEIELPVWYSSYFYNLSQHGFRNSWHLFVILLNQERLRIARAAFIEELKRLRIGASVHFIPLHLHPYYAKKYGYRRGEFPVAEEVYDNIVSIPLYPRLSKGNIYYVIDKIREICHRYAAC